MINMSGGNLARLAPKNRLARGDALCSKRSCRGGAKMGAKSRKINMPRIKLIGKLSENHQIIARELVRYVDEHKTAAIDDAVAHVFNKFCLESISLSKQGFTLLGVRQIYKWLQSNKIII